MDGSFFGFDATLPSLGSGKSEDCECLTADVEEEDERCDALNEETFGDDIPVGDDWEGNDFDVPGSEANGSDSKRKQSSSTPTITPSRSQNSSGGLEKFISPLYGLHSSLSHVFSSSTDNRDYELEESINQLVLDDDDEPDEILERGKAIPISKRIVFRSSPPPPAIFEPDLTGSPLTSSIWSSVQEPSKSDRLKEVLGIKTSKPAPLNSSMLEDPCIVSLSNKIPQVPQMVTSSKLPSNVKTLEEIERDLLQGNTMRNTASPIPPGARSLEEVERDLLQSQTNIGRFVSDIEREMVTGPQIRPQTNASGTPLHMLHPQMNGAILHPFRLVPPPPIHPQMHHHLAGPGSPSQMNVLPVQNYLNLNRMIPPQLIALAGRMHPFQNAIVPPDQLALANHLRFGPPFNFNPQQGRMPMPPGFENFQRFNNMNRPNMRNQNMQNLLQNPLRNQQQQRMGSRDFNHNPHDRGWYNNDEDEYANLMTDKEKDWLIKIQLIQLQCEKPHIDDYYHTTYMAKKRNKLLDKKETKEAMQVESLLSRVRSESKTYEPVQYIGSLGKLQATSVHFPRKIIDVNVMNADDGDSKMVNKDILRLKQTLLEIEKVYTTVLEYEDALNEIEACTDEEERNKHENSRDQALVSLLSAISAFNEDRFGQIMAIRKGRHLLDRIVPLLSQNQVKKIIHGIFQNFPLIARRDQNDRILFNFLDSIRSLITESDFNEVIELNRRLQNQTDHSKQKHLSFVLQHELGIEVTSLLILRAEQLYEEKKTTPDLETSWLDMIEYMLEVIHPDCPLLRSSKDVLKHLHRFPIDRAKLDINLNSEQAEK